MPLLETKGAASAQGFGLTLQQAAFNYIEDVFSTWLYTGNGSTQTITNGIDLSGKGGLVWFKYRNGPNGPANHQLYDTARGVQKKLATNTTAAEATELTGLTAFNANGFSFGSDGNINASSSDTYASWTFREQAKFFDVVTYTGNGTTQNIAHSLGSTPGCIIVKSYSSGATYDWAVYHRSLGATKGVYLNTTQAEQTNNSLWNDTTPTSTQFTVGNSGGASSSTNANGVTYVAYLFAHDAGGFGLTGTDNVISCGSWTDSGSGTQTITLGYEPQFVIYKRTDASSNWVMLDNMRGWPVVSASGSTANLYPNLSNAESGGNYGGNGPTATGFNMPTLGGGTYIYIAIRRGPMKTPTTGTSVFNPLARTGTGTNPTVVTTTNNLDLLMSFPRTASPAAYGMCFWDKLRGISPMLQSATTGAEISTNTTRVLQGWLNTGYQAGADFIEGYLNYSGSTYVNYPITRAPGFFDVVCYRGNSASTQEISHNLTVRPEMIILKSRDTSNWGVLAQSGSTAYRYNLNSDLQGTNTTIQITDFSTTSVIYVGSGWWLTDSGFNASGTNYVAYLFASCPGVSKVGSYTGNGSSQTINCGFTGGARFIMIKRTDNTAGWYVYDSARGITSGNDPYLLMNSTAAEVTGTNYVDTASTGFQLVTGATAVNGNGASYIFLAIA